MFSDSRCFMLQDYKADEDPALFQSVKTKRGPLGPNWKVLGAVTTALWSLYQQKNEAHGSFRTWLNSNWGRNFLWPSTHFLSPQWHPTAAQSLPVPPGSHQDLSQEGMGCVSHTRDPHRDWAAQCCALERITGRLSGTAPSYWSECCFSVIMLIIITT